MYNHITVKVKEKIISEKLFNLILGLQSGWAWVLFILCIAVGFVLLVKGADVFVNSASNLAKLAKIPAIVIGLTIVAFGTSMPEASVSITAVATGNDGISIGNIIGSNMFNLFFILGLSAIIKPVVLDRIVVKRDITIMLVSSYILVLAGFLFGSNGNRALVWFEGVVLLVIFVSYLIYMIRYETKHQIVVETKPDEKKISLPLTLLWLVLSLVAIVGGGTLVNAGAKGVAVKIGFSETLAGLTICAIGTSLPELVTSIVALKKNEADIAIGNVIGSNIFNVMFILGLCSIISPLAVDLFAIIDIVIMAVLFTAFFIYSLCKKDVNKWAGISMLIIYILYFAFIVAREFIF